MRARLFFRHGNGPATSTCLLRAPSMLQTSVLLNSTSMSPRLIVSLRLSSDVLLSLGPPTYTTPGATLAPAMTNSTVSRYAANRQAFREKTASDIKEWHLTSWHNYLAAGDGSPWDIVEALGLATTGHRFKPKFFTRNALAMEVDVHLLVERVAASPDQEGIVQAAFTGSLDDDIRVVFEKHGGNIWGSNLDNRWHLRVPAADSLYSSHLLWENTDDKKRCVLSRSKLCRHQLTISCSLEGHFKQWVFFRAANLRRLNKKKKNGKGLALT